MKKLILGALVAATISGCQTISDEAALYTGREESLTNIVANTWQLKAVWPWEDQAIRLREGLYEKAQQHCRKEDKGAQLLDAVTQKRNGKPGSEGYLVFRCVSSLPAPASGLFSDDEK